MSSRTFRPWALALGVVVYLWMLAGVSWADEPATASMEHPDHAASAPAQPRFLRVTRDDEGDAVALETAIVRYVPRGASDPAPQVVERQTERSGGAAPADADSAATKPAEELEAFAPPADLVVDLIGAVHIGERAYYEQINREFKNYEVVLYELVAPPGTRIPKGGAASAHPVAMLQGGMKSMLGLESQTELVDYQAENLVHADMSPEELNRSMEARGDGFMAMFFRMLGQSIAQQARDQVLRQSGAKLPRRASQTDLLAALLNPNRGAGGLKQMLADQFENMEETMRALEGPQGSSLISERNKVALAELRKQVQEGKRRIAVFYGAGHLPDLERRLLDDHGLKRSAERWLQAWDLKAASRPADDADKQPADAQAPDGAAEAESTASPGR
ncbi:MAG: hypothetical protein K2Y37_14400 [Pirellulales bacterium]|nr:hypothetical protein [Pirellulales bacterium]